MFVIVSLLSTLINLAESGCTSTTAQKVQSVEYIGHVYLQQGATIQDTEIKGISGIVRKGSTNYYYTINDDQDSPAGYMLYIDLKGDDYLNDGDVIVGSVFHPLAPNGELYGPKVSDFESCAEDQNGNLWLVSEVLKDKYMGFIGQWNVTDWKWQKQLTFDHLKYDELFLDKTRGIPSGAGPESITLTPDFATMVAGTETALYQDGDFPTTNSGSPARIFLFDMATGLPNGYEYIYWVESNELEADRGNNALVDLLMIDQYYVLSLEREWASGITTGDVTRPGKLYQFTFDGDNIYDKFSIDGTEKEVTKELILDIDDWRESNILERVGSLEALAWGPDLSDGRKCLFVVEDNDGDRDTQIIAMAVTLVSTNVDVFCSAFTTIPSLFLIIIFGFLL